MPKSEVDAYSRRVKALRKKVVKIRGVGDPPTEPPPKKSLVKRAWSRFFG